MSARVHVGVMGAGSIGCYVGGRLLADDDAAVTFVGRQRLADEIAEHGLTVADLDGCETTITADRVTYETNVKALGGCDTVLLSVKSAQTIEAARQLAQVLAPNVAVVSMQNGVRNPATLREHLPEHRIVAGIVGFNVVSQGAGRFHQGTSGPIMLEAWDDAGHRGLVAALVRSGLSIEERVDIAPDQWTKLLVNLNNAVSALSGAPTRDLLLSPPLRRIVAAVVDEGLGVLRAGHIRPAKLRGVPVGLMPKVLRLPTPLVRLVTAAQMRVDPHARSSMWEDLTKGRPTEVDYLNGEIVRLAELSGVDAPINRRIVELVHEAEYARAGSPRLGAEMLWSKLTAEATT